MLLNLSHIGQIALPVADVDRAEAFYERVIGLTKLYRFGDLTFFDCAGVRLLLEKAAGPVAPTSRSPSPSLKSAASPLPRAPTSSREWTITICGWHSSSIPTATRWP